jgi:hypothetical protein
MGNMGLGEKPYGMGVGVGGMKKEFWDNENRGLWRRIQPMKITGDDRYPSKLIYAYLVYYNSV